MPCPVVALCPPMVQCGLTVTIHTHLGSGSGDGSITSPNVILGVIPPAAEVVAAAAIAAAEQVWALMAPHLVSRPGIDDGNGCVRGKGGGVGGNGGMGGKGGKGSAGGGNRGRGNMSGDGRAGNGPQELEAMMSEVAALMMEMAPPAVARSATTRPAPGPTTPRRSRTPAPRSRIGGASDPSGGSSASAAVPMGPLQTWLVPPSPPPLARRRALSQLPQPPLQQRRHSDPLPMVNLAMHFPLLPLAEAAPTELDTDSEVGRGDLVELDTDAHVSPYDELVGRDNDSAAVDSSSSGSLRGHCGSDLSGGPDDEYVRWGGGGTWGGEG